MLSTFLCIAVTCVGAANASLSLDGGWRKLQAHGHGVADVNICSDPNASPLTKRVGTLHDDQTDEQVDCTQGGCGGADTGHNGYSDNLDCSKTITAPQGNIVALVFTHFNLEQCGEVTSCDYVEVFDGPTSSSPSLGQFSGANLPSNLRSTSNSVTVHFHTDTGNAALTPGATEDPGFYLDWHFIEVLNNQGICAAPAVITDSSGIIHDDEGHTGVDCTAGGCGGNGAGNNGYGDGLNCYITLQADGETQVQLSFTQMNLEQTNHNGCGSCPEGGCDYVAVYDGPDENAPLIGRYSGNPAQMPTAVSSGNSMHIRFMTDTGNCNIEGSEDPGFFAQWTFLENGEDICHPTAPVLHGRHGVIHDDAVGNVNCASEGGPCNGADTGSNGYGDNLDCGVRIHVARNSVVNLKFDQVNLECGGTTATDIEQCHTTGGDAVEIFDGRDDSAPLLGHVSGTMTDSFSVDGAVANYGDSFTSTGRDMYVRFRTDVGNYGLSTTTQDPGFYASWTAIREGMACPAFTPQPHTGLIGHNNEQLTSVSLNDCEAACCARTWCKSFDFLPGSDGPDSNTGQCALADLDASNDFGKIVINPDSPWTLYERNGMTPPSATLGLQGCTDQLLAISGQVNAVCCPAGGCGNGSPPTSCSEECATLWLPFSRECSEMIAQSDSAALAELAAVTTNCEKTEYGRYRAGSNHGRCSDGDQQQWIDEIGPACCGADLQYCPGYEQGQLQVPMQNGQPICVPDCADTVEQMYAECHPRFEREQPAETMSAIHAFLAICQGMPPGGGH